MRDVKVGFARRAKFLKNGKRNYSVAYHYWRSQTTFFRAQKIIGSYWFARNFDDFGCFQDAIVHETIHNVLYNFLGRKKFARRATKAFDNIFGAIDSMRNWYPPPNTSNTFTFREISRE